MVEMHPWRAAWHLMHINHMCITASVFMMAASMAMGVAVVRMALSMATVAVPFLYMDNFNIFPRL
jgi:hypothetical protein